MRGAGNNIRGWDGAKSVDKAIKEVTLISFVTVYEVDEEQPDHQ